DLRQLSAAARRLPHERGAAPVDIAAVPALSATTNGAGRTTGRAFVVGLPSSYLRLFPHQLRLLLGDLSGPVLLQQPAANLAAAATAVEQARSHFEASLAGAALVGDNLGTALSAAREDALYGELLFLLLGLPAFLVALAVTALVLGARGERRLRELALLRLRG